MNKPTKKQKIEMLEIANALLKAEIAELEKDLEIANAFNVDVVKCLSRIASVFITVPAYIDMSRRCIKAIKAKQAKALEKKANE
jgi:hypothetical protein|tara:strand:- start:1936 stop:2187 length:252 start_codon:yes stop_codon:yes gene_type:complete